MSVHADQIYVIFETVSDNLYIRIKYRLKDSFYKSSCIIYILDEPVKSVGSSYKITTVIDFSVFFMIHCVSYFL